MKQMNIETFLDHLAEQPVNQVVCFSLDDDDGFTFGACFHELYEMNVLSIGYWGSTSKEDIGLLFVSTPTDLRESEEDRELTRNFLQSLLRDWGCGPDLYLKESTCQYQGAYYTLGQCAVCSDYKSIEYKAKNKEAPANGGNASYCPECGRSLAGD